MAVAADHAAVKANVLCLEGRHQTQLRREKIALGNTVFFVEDRHDVELDKLLFVLRLGIGARADQHIQILAGKRLCHGLCHLLLRQVRQQVGHTEAAFVFFVAPLDLYARAVELDNNAVQRQRDRRPLVLLHAAVIVGLEERQVGGFIERIGLEVDARRINVCDRQTRTVFDAVFADDCERHRLASVDIVDLVACFVCRLGVKRNESRLFCCRDGVSDRLALHGRGIQKRLVALAKIVSCLDLLRRKRLDALRLIHQLLTEQRCLCFFFSHNNRFLSICI